MGIVVHLVAVSKMDHIHFAVVWRVLSPKIRKNGILENWTGGCARKMELTCDKGDWFFKFERTRLPDYSVSLGNMTLSQCESKCHDNCSCTAYAYANLTIETTVHCMNWFGALVDLNHNAFIGKDLFVRLHSSDQVTSMLRLVT